MVSASEFGVGPTDGPSVIIERSFPLVHPSNVVHGGTGIGAFVVCLSKHENELRIWAALIVIVYQPRR